MGISSWAALPLSCPICPPLAIHTLLRNTHTKKQKLAGKIKHGKIKHRKIRQNKGSGRLGGLLLCLYRAGLCHTDYKESAYVALGN